MMLTSVTASSARLNVASAAARESRPIAMSLSGARSEASITPSPHESQDTDGNHVYASGGGRAIAARESLRPELGRTTFPFSDDSVLRVALRLKRTARLNLSSPAVTGR